MVKLQKLMLAFSFLLILGACSMTQQLVEQYSDIHIEPLIPENDRNIDSASFRALAVHNQEVLIGGSNRFVGVLSPKGRLRIHPLGEWPNADFRAVAHNSKAYFALSAGSPALLYRGTAEEEENQLVYREEGADVFYDAMAFWNAKEGIAFGDEVNGCMSVIITRDGGHSWKKLPCDQLPIATEGEGAFAASNTNISIVGDKTWLASGTTIYYSPDRGKQWERFPLPFQPERRTHGIYSIDFYDESIGVAMGGDYTNPENRSNHLLRTTDGGKTWSILSNKHSPGYRSCIQYVPNSNGQGLLAVGFQGIDYSSDGGETWKHISDDGFYSFRFTGPSKGVLVGKGRIARFQLLK